MRPLAIDGTMLLRKGVLPAKGESFQYRPRNYPQRVRVIRRNRGIISILFRSAGEGALEIFDRADALFADARKRSEKRQEEPLETNEPIVYSTDHAKGILYALVGMSLQWGFLHSVTFLGSVFGSQVDLEPSGAWIINSLCTFSVFAIIFFWAKRHPLLISQPIVRRGMTSCLLAGVVLIVVGNTVVPSLPLIYAGNVFIACGTTPMIVIWGEMYRYLNPKYEQLLVTLAAAAFAIGVYLVTFLLPHPLSVMLFAVLPFASLFCLFRSYCLLSASSRTWKTPSARKRKSPALFYLCIAVFSLPYNYLRNAEAVQSVWSSSLEWSSILAASLLVVIVVAFAEAYAEKKGALLVPGVVLFLLSAAMLLHLFVGSSFPLVVPTLLYSGYYLFLAMVYLALGPLVASTDENPTRLFAGAMLANVAGLLAGSAIGAVGSHLDVQATTVFVFGITYALLFVGFLLLNNRSFSLFRVNSFDEDEYSFEYVVPLEGSFLPAEVKAGSFAGERVVQSESMIDAITAHCAYASEQFKLSARESEVLVYLVRGKTIASIAAELVVSENTVKAHTKAVYRKLEIHSREELLRAIEGIGMAQPGD